MRALPSQRDEQMQTRGPAGLHEQRELDPLAQLPCRQCYVDDLLERCTLRIKIEHAPVRPLQGRGATGPDMQRDRAEVDDVEERGDVIADEVVDLALGILAPHALGA